jgi:transcriptional regulator with XRE-family HTH domain
MHEAVTMAYADALRGYVSHLRMELGATQADVAEAMGIARNTYISWETGGTKDIKVPRLIRGLRFLGVPLDYLEELEGAETIEQGRKIADGVLSKMTPEQVARAKRIQDKFEQVVKLGEEDPDLLRSVVARLREDAKNDPGVLDAIIVYLDGRRSGRSSR